MVHFIFSRILFGSKHTDPSFIRTCNTDGSNVITLHSGGSNNKAAGRLQVDNTCTHVYYFKVKCNQNYSFLHFCFIFSDSRALGHTIKDPGGGVLRQRIWCLEFFSWATGGSIFFLTFSNGDGRSVFLLQLGRP